MKQITSREYKVMLQAESFGGDESAVKDRVRAFYTDLQSVLGTEPLNIELQVDDESSIKKNRKVSFFDVPDKQPFLLNGRAYVLRERIKIKKNGDPKDGEIPQLTLKCRHRDRYFAQDRNMLQAVPNRDEIKFEEDLKFELGKGDQGIMVTLYSFSSKQDAEIDLASASVKDAIDLYPGLADHLDPTHAGQQLVRVGNYSAHQRVVTGASFELSKDQAALEAECGIIIWYEHGGSLEEPAVVEFSARYLGQGGHDPTVKAFDGAVSKKVHDAFVATRHGLNAWIDPESPTKTRFIYDQA